MLWNGESEDALATSLFQRSLSCAAKWPRLMLAISRGRKFLPEKHENFNGCQHSTKKDIMLQKNKSPKLDEEKAAQIKWLWENTALNQAQIAAELGAMNQGRVSEVLTGHRFLKVKPQPLEGWA